MAMQPVSPKVKKALIEAYELHGSASAACAAAGLSIYRWNWLMRQDEKFRDQIDVIRADKIGRVRNKLWENILKGHPSSIFFYLNNYDPEMKNDFRQTMADGAGLLPLSRIDKNELKEFVEKKKRDEKTR